MNEEFDASRVATALRRRGAADYICPICKGRNFAVQGEVATITTTNKIRTMSLGKYIPSAMLICTNCGNIQFFALGILDSEVMEDECQTRQTK